MIKLSRHLSNENASNGSISILKRRRKDSIVGTESFLDISALHDSFLSSESQGDDEKSSSDYDSSNPYTTSSDSSLEQEKIIKVTQNTKVRSRIHRHINKKILLIDIMMQNYPLSLETLGKFEISEVEAHMFLILKVLQSNYPDFKVLLTAFEDFFPKPDSGKDNGKNNPFWDCKLSEITEITPIFVEKIKHVFVINCTHFLNQSLNDETLFPLFRTIIEGIKEFNYELSRLNLEVFLNILKEKRYEILKFLIDKRDIRLYIPEDRDIGTLLPPNNYNDINKSKSFKKTLANHAKIDLQLVVLYYVSECPEHYIVKRLLFEVTLNKHQYKEILQIFIEYKLNSLAKEITKALLDTENDMYQQINFSNNLNFSLISENLEYVWFCTTNPDFDLHHWLQNPETQSLLATSLTFSEGKNFEYTLYFLNKIEIWSDEKLTKSIANIIHKRLEVPGLDNVLYTFYNPLKVVILVLEFLTNLSKKVVYNRSSLLMIINKIYGLAQLLISKINDDKELNLILRDLDLEQRRLIYIIYENDLWELIGMPNVENVIDILWNGSILTDFDILSIFSVSSNFFAAQKGLNYPKKENLYFARQSISDFQHHFTFQRVVWTYNCRIRLQLDNSLIILFLLFTVIGIEEIHKIRIDYFDKGMKNELDPLFASFTGEIKSTFHSFMILFIIYVVNFPLRLLNCIYYSKKLQIRYKINNEDILDIILGLLSLISLIFFLQIDGFPLEEIDLWMKTLFCSFIVIIVIKIFFCFKIIRMFGPWMKALWVIFEACMKFMVIFMITVVCYSFLAHISFFDCPNGRFVSVSDALYYFFEVSGSQFTFDDYTNYKVVFSPVFIMSFVFIINIIYMNLIISILSYNFETASRVGRKHFNHGLIGSIRKYEYDPDYGCLVVMPIYLSFLNLAFLIPSVFTKNTDKLKKINKILCRIGYFPISVTIVLLLLGLNLALIPCYFFCNLLRISFVIATSHKAEQIPLFFQWAVIGVPLMFWQTISDSYHTFIYLWFAKKLVAEEHKAISNFTYHILCKTMTDMYKKNINICEFHQVIEAVNQEEKNTPIRLLEKSSVFRNFCSFHFKNKGNSPSIFNNVPTPFMGNQKYNAYDIITNHNIRDPEQLLDFLGKFSIVTKELDENTKEQKKVVILCLKNILKLMKWYNKTSIRQTNYQLLYEAIRKIES